MSYITSLTNAQLQTLNNDVVKLQQLLQLFAQGTAQETTAYATLSTSLNTLMDTLIKDVSGAIVVNNKELTGVTPTGTYATKVKFTVTNGAITAITLS